MSVSKNIPSRLTRQPRWVRWRDMRGSKKPLRLDGTLASVSDPSHWADHDLAEAMGEAADAGLGYVFAQGDGLVGIDLDNCLENGVLAEWAEAIIKSVNSYCEISPSGRGVKIWVGGELPIPTSGKRTDGPGGPGTALEVYHHSRYFAFTGQPLPGYEGRDVIDNQEAIDQLWSEHFAGKLSTATGTASYQGEYEKDDAPQWEIDELKARLMAMDDSVSGERGHDKLFAMVCTVRKAMLNEGQVRDMLQWINQHKCSPEWTDDQLWHKYEGAKKTVEVFAPLTEEEIERHTRLDAKADACIRIGSETTAICGPPIRTGLVDITEYGMGSSEIEFIVQDISVKNDLFFIAGPTKSLKSAIGFDFMFSLSTGTPFLGYFDVARKYKTAFFSAETRDTVMQRRYRTLCEERGADAEGQLFMSNLAPRIDQDQWKEAILWSIRELGLEYVMIDPCTMALNSNPNDTSFQTNASVVYDRVYGLWKDASELGCAIGFIHHISKGNATNRPRGEAAGFHTHDEMTGAGVSEVARGNLMIGRRSPYMSDGCHALGVNVMGTDGFTGRYNLDIDEGIDGKTTGQKWDVTVTDLTDDTVAFEPAGADEPRLTPLQTKVLESVYKLSRGGLVTQTAVRDDVGLSSDAAGSSLDALVNLGQLGFRKSKPGEIKRSKPAKVYWPAEQVDADVAKCVRDESEPKVEEDTIVADALITMEDEAS
ncbi:MAG: AAA family ATPase [Planctomycetota bacterium]